MTTTTESAEPANTPAETAQSKLSIHVAKLAGTLQSGAIANRAKPVADLARLRRSLDAPPGGDPVVWRIVFDGFPNQPDQPWPNPIETAAYSAICLFAIHQQSRDNHMHKLGWKFSLGRSIRQLAQPVGESSPSDATVRRFNALVTADNFDEIIRHLRSLIGQLRASSIPLDYGQLADDLNRWQNSDLRSGVRLKWSRDFSRVPKPPESSDSTPPNTNSDNS
ncbi:putative CRISPR-associated protein [Gordonia effusa NBRC 100432]|uniref:Putative CRISPR-associated protein n=1 Tax=Gordonia effusa NBRC 100432 TaxID=1077974 RepID=H0R5C7_9ACTN|nr:type I-E CRISPR-associated protein Cse2/CasB [Gordonia effusa]GAB20278.1 putative CRISPR-associated protein [Gordonia effusa NBRC 100432]